MKELIKEIASRTDNQEVIKALFTMPGESTKHYLARNPNLTLPQRTQLLKASNVALAKTLAVSATGDEAIIQILKDRRRTVHSELFRAGLKGATDGFIATLLPELQNQNLSSSQSNLNHWLASEHPPKRELTRRLAPSSHVSVQLQLLADRNLYNSAEVLSILTSTKIPPYQNIAPALDTYPELIPAMLEAMRGNQAHRIDNGVLFSALTSSRHIFDQDVLTEIAKYCGKFRITLAIRMLLKLYDNPNLSAQTLRSVLELLTSLKAPIAKSLNTKLTARLSHETLTNSAITQPWQEVLAAPVGTLINQKAMIVEYAGKSFYWDYPTLDPNWTVGFDEETTLAQEQRISLLPLSKLKVDPALPAGTLPKYARPGTSRVLNYHTFINRILPELLPYGQSAVQLFLSLALSWQSNAQELLDATLASIN